MTTCNLLEGLTQNTGGFMQFVFGKDSGGTVAIWLDTDRSEVTFFSGSGGKRYRSYCWDAAIEYPYPF
jgi:hypothetical protein